MKCGAEGAIFALEYGQKGEAVLGKCGPFGYAT
jgi:hypothetical protein